MTLAMETAIPLLGAVLGRADGQRQRPTALLLGTVSPRAPDDLGDQTDLPTIRLPRSVNRWARGIGTPPAWTSLMRTRIHSEHLMRDGSSLCFRVQCHDLVASNDVVVGAHSSHEPPSMRAVGSFTVPQSSCGREGPSLIVTVSFQQLLQARPTSRTRAALRHRCRDDTPAPTSPRYQRDTASISPARPSTPQRSYQALPRVAIGTNAIPTAFLSGPDARVLDGSSPRPAVFSGSRRQKNPLGRPFTDRLAEPGDAPFQQG